MRTDDAVLSDTVLPHETRTDDERLAAAEPDLPGVRQILDLEALRDCFRDGWGDAAVEEVRVTYLRYKPGTSLVAGLVVTGRNGARTRAFAAAHRRDTPQKITKALRAADPDDGGRPALADRALGLALGGASADRRLPGIRRVLRRPGVVEPLVYKPGRRWVAFVDRDGTLGRPSVVKVHAPSRVADHVARHRLLAGLVPTAELLEVGARHGVVRTGFVPGTPLDRLGRPDLRPEEHRPAADHWHAAGTLAAHLHQAPLPRGTGVPLERRHELAVAVEAVAAVRPDLDGAAREIARLVLLAVDGRRERALVHGDLSADQVIVRPDGGLALVDLDRAGIDDPLADLADWVAAEIAAGRTAALDPAEILGPLLVGYREAGGSADPRALTALSAGALLQRATEPFRTHEPGWGARIGSLLTAAHELATEAARPGGGTARSAPAGWATAGPAGAHGWLPAEVREGEARWTLSRAWPRGTGHALLELTDDTGRTVAGQWFADPADLAHAARRAPEPARVAGGILLQPDGADGRLRALAGVLARPGTRLVAHRPGRRAVVRAEWPDGTQAADGPAAEYVKVVRPRRVAGVARHLRHVASLRSAVVPTVLGLDEAAGVLRLSAVGETTLLEAGADPARTAAELGRAWEQVGRVVTELQELVQDGLPAHDAEDEIAAVGAWTRAAVQHGLLDGDEVEAATRTVERELRALPDVPLLGVLHRDLHDKQLLLRGDADGRLGLIDVDTLAVGERALDVANLEVHRELRQLQGLLTPERAEVARAALRRTLPADERLWSRVPAYAAATRLRLAGVYAFRPRWAALGREMLATVELVRRMTHG
ncbi:hypothetical protein GCM10023169_38110 [Georgenia halophila]|uniref:Phosphotransferase n=1 Tax=Georgenia halophila TaxID=620889 RepID=A0ABP8LMB6_9MICO